MRPPITIITPSYNQGKFIERTIRSVLTQAVSPLEYMVFDGGSSDETVEVLKKYTGSLYWQSEKDDGQADAVNRGMQRASGEVIGWLNSDDIYYPGAVSSAISYLGNHPDVDVVYGDAVHINTADEVIERYPTEPWDLKRLKEVCFICQPAVFLRRSVLTRFGMLDGRLRYCMDYEYWLRLGQLGARFAYVNEEWAGSRMYGENKTQGSRREVHREINDMMKNRLGRVPDRWIFNYAHVLLEEEGLRARSPTWFALRVSGKSITASIRWNRGVSGHLLRTVWGWITGNIRNRLQQVRRRS